MRRLLIKIMLAAAMVLPFMHARAHAQAGPDNQVWGTEYAEIDGTFAGNLRIYVVGDELTFVDETVTSPVTLEDLNTNGVSIGTGDARWLKLTADNSPLTGGLVTQSYIDFTEMTRPSTPGANIFRIFGEVEDGKTVLNLLTQEGLLLEILRDSVFIGRGAEAGGISAGEIVYISGATGNKVQVKLAKADSVATMPAVGIALESIANNAFGYIAHIDNVENLDTSSFSEGDQVWVSATTAGGIVNTAPPHPSFDQHVGVVQRSHATLGSIHVNMTPTFTGDEQGTDRNTFKIGDTTAGVIALVFANDFDGTLSWNPTADRTITFPDITGTVIVGTPAVQIDGALTVIAGTGHFGVNDTTLGQVNVFGNSGAGGSGILTLFNDDDHSITTDAHIIRGGNDEASGNELFIGSTADPDAFILDTANGALTTAGSVTAGTSVASGTTITAGTDLLVDGGDFTLGSQVAGKDPAILFDGETNQNTFIYMEDEDRFDIGAQFQVQADRLSFASGTFLIAGDNVNLRTGVGGTTFFDGGAMFTWRDVDGSFATRMSLNSATGEFLVTGTTGINEATPDFRLDVAESSGVVGNFDRLTDDGILVQFERDGSAVGDITVAAGVVSYNAFTGSHYANIVAPVLDAGMLVKMTGTNIDHNGEAVFGAVPTTFVNDQAAFGVFQSLREPSSMFSTREIARLKNKAQRDELARLQGIDEDRVTIPLRDAFEMVEVTEDRITTRSVELWVPDPDTRGMKRVTKIERVRETVGTGQQERKLKDGMIIDQASGTFYRLTTLDDILVAEPDTPFNPHLVASVGNTTLWIVDTGANIEAGDMLISSGVAGHAQVDPKTFAETFVIGRAGQSLDWSTITERVGGVKHAKIDVLLTLDVIRK